MSVSIDRFADFFQSLHGHAPFPWQSRLARKVHESGWPDCIDLPTASGKTACIDIAIFVLACQAQSPAHERTVGRRVFFTVNRRVIVDEAHERARRIREALVRAEGADGILADVARALRSLNAEQNPSLARPLDVAQLRGGIFRDTAWARSLTQPMVVCTTADQLGSRLLFRGYGVSDSMKPVHASLCGCDATILLDEAHVTRAFCQTMQLLPRYQAQRDSVPPLRFVQMTATPAGEVKHRFELGAADLANPILNRRQTAPKPATLVRTDKKKFVADTLNAATGALSDTRKAVGIIVNRVQTARDIFAALKVANPGAEVHLVIGRMRPIDRDDLQAQLRKAVGPERPDALEKPVFVVATQCLEVGADYDFDALVTESASLDALRQRFGRLNRNGRDIEAVATILITPDALKGDDPIYRDAIKHTWTWLQSKKDAEGRVDFGIAAFKTLWDSASDDDRARMLAPSQDAAVLLPAHLDALCQTSPQPVPSPDVRYFIHGPRRDMADVNVCWRADLGDDPGAWPDIVRLLPPTSRECMTVPLHELRRWMAGAANDAPQADVPVDEATDVGKPTRSAAADAPSRCVLVWRGAKETFHTESPADLLQWGRVLWDAERRQKRLRPGDTVVLRPEAGGWDVLGHIPDAPDPADFSRTADETEEQYAERRRNLIKTLDLAEVATRQSRRRVVVRLHDAFPGREAWRGLGDPKLRAMLARAGLIPAAWDEAPKVRLDRHFYRTPDTEAPDAEATPEQVIVFKKLLDASDALKLPLLEEDDEDDNLSLVEVETPVTLTDHTRHVVEHLQNSVARLGLDQFEPTLRAAARLHDLGKADARFQALLGGITPYEAMERPTLLAKGITRPLTQAEKQQLRQRSLLPDGFRHETLSMQIVELHGSRLDLPAEVNSDLLLHLIAAHHGHARPFAPVVIDESADRDQELLHLAVGGHDFDPATRQSWTPAHRLDSGVAERFWTLTRAHGWWGLAYLESILRLADHQASAMEQEGAAT